MKRYRATVEWADGWWAIEVPTVPGVYSQTRRLDGVAAAAADALSTFLDTEVSPAAIDVRPVSGSRSEG